MQLAEMTRRETPSGHRHDTGNDRLIQQRGARCEACLGGRTSLTGAPLPSAATSTPAKTPDNQPNRLTYRPWG
jgi:hypothetical protein